MFQKSFERHLILQNFYHYLLFSLISAKCQKGIKNYKATTETDIEFFLKKKLIAKKDSENEWSPDFFCHLIRKNHFLPILSVISLASQFRLFGPEYIDFETEYYLITFTNFL